MLTHNTQPTDILAFTVKLLKIHTCSHTCTHQPLPSVSKDIFLHLTCFSLQKENIQIIPKINLSHSAKNFAHFRIMLSIKYF